MDRLFALADLHLSGTGAKPMDVFGELWRDHVSRMASAWDATVDDSDTVMLPGDLSWARTLDEARLDLDWIARRPGRKVLLRGNHDSWWSGAARVRAALPPSCSALHNDSAEFGPWVIVGTRGWTSPEEPGATAADAKVFRRELERLRASIADADRRFGRERPRLAMTHFPPWLVGRAPTEVVPILRDAGTRLCVYGHLHGADHALAVEGLREGIVFRFVASDAIGFRPREIELPELLP